VCRVCDTIGQNKKCRTKPHRRKRIKEEEPNFHVVGILMINMVKISMESLIKYCSKLKVKDHSSKSIKRIGANLMESTSGRSGFEWYEDKGTYSKWSKWTTCTKSCNTQRFK
jgi:hypothetical protein